MSDTEGKVLSRAQVRPEGDQDDLSTSSGYIDRTVSRGQASPWHDPRADTRRPPSVRGERAGFVLQAVDTTMPVPTATMPVSAVPATVDTKSVARANLAWNAGRDIPALRDMFQIAACVRRTPDGSTSSTSPYPQTLDLPTRVDEPNSTVDLSVQDRRESPPLVSSVALVRATIRLQRFWRNHTRARRFDSLVA